MVTPSGYPKSINPKKVVHLFAAYIPINKIPAHMNWFSLRSMHINRELPFTTLPEKKEALIIQKMVVASYPLHAN